jgi:hypothetical protein
MKKGVQTEYVRNCSKTADGYVGLLPEKTTTIASSIEGFFSFALPSCFGSIRDIRAASGVTSQQQAQGHSVTGSLEQPTTVIIH